MVMVIIRFGEGIAKGTNGNGSSYRQTGIDRLARVSVGVVVRSATAANDGEHGESCGSGKSGDKASIHAPFDRDHVMIIQMPGRNFYTS
jgi:hypothetical protein